MSLTVGNYSNNIFANASSIVSGSELADVSKQILSAAPNTQNTKAVQNEKVQIDFSKVNKINNNGLNVFGADSNVDTQTVKNLSGYNVNISNQAQAAIQALKARAAVAQTVNMPQIMDGKVNLPPKTSQTNDVKSVFSTANTPRYSALSAFTGKGGPSLF